MAAPYGDSARRRRQAGTRLGRNGRRQRRRRASSASTAPSSRRRSKRTDAAYRQLERGEAADRFRWLYGKRYGPDRWMYSDQELDDLAEEMWGYFNQRQAARRERRRAIEQIQRDAAR